MCGSIPQVLLFVNCYPNSTREFDKKIQVGLTQ